MSRVAPPPPASYRDGPRMCACLPAATVTVAALRTGSFDALGRPLSFFGGCERPVVNASKRLPSSPPRLLCRSPGPGPSVSSLSRPKPHLSWVMKLTLAHTTALTASHTPVSPTDTAGTHSHFTHAQAQPHQSTALLRMGKVHRLVTQAAPGSPLHSAPLQLCRALPQQHTDGKL